MGACISLPLLECMIPLHAADKAAEATASPKRSAFIYLANGVHSLNYQILTPGKDYQFSRSLKPLEKHREVITPISGLHHPGALGHHHNCISVWLTGGKLGPSDRNTISVDQKMAEITAQHTRYSSWRSPSPEDPSPGLPMVYNCHHNVAATKYSLRCSKNQKAGKLHSVASFAAKAACSTPTWRKCASSNNRWVRLTKVAWNNI
jgi:hypothetical protein